MRGHSPACALAPLAKIDVHTRAWILKPWRAVDASRSHPRGLTRLRGRRLAEASESARAFALRARRRSRREALEGGDQPDAGTRLDAAGQACHQLLTEHDAARKNDRRARKRLAVLPEFRVRAVAAKEHRAAADLLARRRKSSLCQAVAALGEFNAEGPLHVIFPRSLQHRTTCAGATVNEDIVGAELDARAERAKSETRHVSIVVCPVAAHLLQRSLLERVERVMPLPIRLVNLVEAALAAPVCGAQPWRPLHAGAAYCAH